MVRFRVRVKFRVRIMVTKLTKCDGSSRGCKEIDGS